jgi:hypothetical protein
LPTSRTTPNKPQPSPSAIERVIGTRSQTAAMSAPQSADVAFRIESSEADSDCAA